MNSVNFSRYLQRLGWKTTDEPRILERVQPVNIVADHRDLVSANLGPTALVGGSTPVALNQGALFVGQTPVPLRIVGLFSQNVASQLSIQIGIGAPPIPFAAAPASQPMIPQRMDDLNSPFQSIWTVGQWAAGVPFAAGLPSILVSNALNVFQLLPGESLFVPAGGFISLATSSSVGNPIVSLCFKVCELPNAKQQ